MNAFTSDDPGFAASAWLSFSLRACSDLEPKGALDATLWLWMTKGHLQGSICGTVAQLPFAPPTHDQLCWSRAKEWPLNHSASSAFVHQLNYGELKSVQNFKSTWRLATISTKIKILFTCMLTRRSRCTALRFIRCGVASMESHSSMRIKKNPTTNMTMELEVYLPVPSSVEM